MRRSDLVESAELFVASLRDAGRASDWSARVDGLDWTCWEVADHVVTVLLVFGLRVVTRAQAEVPMPRSRDPQRLATGLVDLVGATAQVLDKVVADLPAGGRVFHPTGRADRDRYVVGTAGGMGRADHTRRSEALNRA